MLLALKHYERKIHFLEANMENLLLDKYKSSASTKYTSQLKAKEFKVHSQNGEDGLILYIFSQIGVTNRRFIEFGIGNGKQCNTANLSLNFGWSGLLLEGNANSVKQANNYYTHHKKIIHQDQVKVIEAFITTDNINDLFVENGVAGELDLLSIDIDGNDYWVWDTIQAVDPRVVIIEYNGAFGPERSITVEYDPKFYRYNKHPSGFYFGASAKALEKLGKKKGYSLIGCDSEGVNMFFVKDELLNGTELQKISATEAFYPPPARGPILAADQWNLVKSLKYIEV